MSEPGGPGSVHMQTRFLAPADVRENMWIMPWYDEATGLTAEGGMPIPEKVVKVIRGDDITRIITANALGQEIGRVFRSTDTVEVVV